MASTAAFQLSLLDSWSSVSTLEPTHIIFKNSSSLDRLTEVLRMMNVIKNDEIYEAWVDHSLVEFRIIVHSDPAAAPFTTIEFRKIRGCTFNFVCFFVNILKIYKAWSEHVPPKVEVDEECAKRCWEWITSHESKNYNETPLRLRNNLPHVDEIMEPVMAMICSKWSESMQNGLECTASITDHPDNASILIQSDKFIGALSQIRPLPLTRFALRCLARTVANLVNAPWPPGITTTPEPLVGTIASLREIYAHHKEDPIWMHVNMELRRI